MSKRPPNTRTIKIEIGVTDEEYALLVKGKCDKPHPARLRDDLIRLATSNVIREYGCPLPTSCKVRPRCSDGCLHPPKEVADFYKR